MQVDTVSCDIIIKKVALLSKYERDTERKREGGIIIVWSDYVSRPAARSGHAIFHLAIPRNVGHCGCYVLYVVSVSKYARYSG